MFLSDQDIELLLDSGELAISPLMAGSLGPASVDLRLGDSIRQFRAEEIALGETGPGSTALVSIPPDGYLLNPGEFVLASTLETVSIPATHHGIVETRGSMARAGLMVHANDGHVDAGYSGKITLEIKNLNNNCSLRLFPNLAICQLFIATLSSSSTRPYSGKYQNSDGPTEHAP